MDSLPHNSLALQGLGLSWGSVHWNQPRFPTLDERAALLGDRLPHWAIASGTTAGWVWTGMGYPEPWSVLRPTQPAVSPLQGTLWSARERNPLHHSIVRLSGLEVLTPESTAREVLLSSEPTDSRAAQLWVLEELCERPLESLVGERRSAKIDRENATHALEALEQLHQHYPDITR